MLNAIRKFFGREDTPQTSLIPSGQRVYAVGDIHGRLDLFQNVIDLIEEDDAERAPATTTVVLLGDLIDRGPDSAGVVALARKWGEQRWIEYLKGNHEEMLLVARNDASALRDLLRFGGVETLASYGLDEHIIASSEIEEVQQAMNTVIPADDFDFLDRFKNMVRIGDYLFVHAGIRPRVPLEVQQGRDCRWIREPFLSHKGDFGAFVIHGHTIKTEPDIAHNRIGIDTGAYLHGTLTAIGLEGDKRWFITASVSEETNLGTAALSN